MEILQIFIDLIYRQIDYQASSPDEKALVEGCAKIGFLFCGESNSKLSIKLLNRRVSEFIELLCIIIITTIITIQLTNSIPLLTGTTSENFKPFGIKVRKTSYFRVYVRS